MFQWSGTDWPKSDDLGMIELKHELRAPESDEEHDIRPKVSNPTFGHGVALTQGPLRRNGRKETKSGGYRNIQEQVSQKERVKGVCLLLCFV